MKRKTKGKHVQRKRRKHCKEKDLIPKYEKPLFTAIQKGLPFEFTVVLIRLIFDFTCNPVKYSKNIPKDASHVYDTPLAALACCRFIFYPRPVKCNENCLASNPALQKIFLRKYKSVILPNSFANISKVVIHPQAQHVELRHFSDIYIPRSVTSLKLHYIWKNLLTMQIPKSVTKMEFYGSYQVRQQPQILVPPPASVKTVIFTGGSFRGGIDFSRWTNVQNFTFGVGNLHMLPPNLINLVLKEYSDFRDVIMPKKLKTLKVRSQLYIKREFSMNDLPELEELELVGQSLKLNGLSVIGSNLKKLRLEKVHVEDWYWIEFSKLEFLELKNITVKKGFEYISKVPNLKLKNVRVTFEK